MSDQTIEYQDSILDEEEDIQPRPTSSRRSARPHPRSAKALAEAGVYEDKTQRTPTPAPVLEDKEPDLSPLIDKAERERASTPDELTEGQKAGISDIVNKFMNETGSKGGYLTREQFAESSQRERQILETGRAMIPARGGRFELANIPQVYATPAERYGSQVLLADQIGLPPRMLENTEVRKAAEQNIRMTRAKNVFSRGELPRSMANWFATRDNYLLSYDDVENLTETYRAWNELARHLAPKREGTPFTWFQAGLSQTAHSFYEANVADAESGGVANPRGNPFIDAYNKLAKSIDEGDADMWKSIAEAIAPEPYLMPITAGGRFAHDVISNMPYTLYSIAKSAAIFAAAGATGGLGALGATSTGVLLSTMQGTYEEAWIERGGVYSAARSRGATPEQARDMADRAFWQNVVLLAGPEALQNMLAFGGAGKWARRTFPATSKYIDGMSMYTRATGKFLMSAVSEALEEGGQEIISANALGDEVDTGQVAWAMALGGVSGGAFHAGGSAVRRLSKKGLRGFFTSERQANEDEARNRADELVDRLAATALTERVPQRAEDFIEKTGELGSDAVVYIDGGAILSTYQNQGMGTLSGAIEAAAQDLELSDKEKAELKEAAETGGDVALPAAKVAVKAARDADFYNGIRGDMKFDELAYTDNELKDADKEAVANIQSEMKKALDDLRSQNAAVKNMHTKLTEAFKKVFWPEGVTKDGDMPEYFDAVAQLWAYNKVRQAEAQGVSVESMMGDIEVVNDENGNVNIVLRHGARDGEGTFFQVYRYEEGDKKPGTKYVQKKINGRLYWVLEETGQKPEGYVPSRIGTAYKLMEVEVDKDGKAIPGGEIKALFAGDVSYELGKWQFAEGFDNEEAGLQEDMNLDPRFGWHLGTGIPSAPHLMSKGNVEQPNMGYKSKRGKRFKRMWVEVLFDASENFTGLAEQTVDEQGNKMTGKKKDISGLAPFGGFYLFQEGNKSDWIISSGVNLYRIIPENTSDPNYKEGDVTREQILDAAGYSEELAWREKHLASMTGDDKIEKIRQNDKLTQEEKDRKIKAILDRRAENEARIAELRSDPKYTEHDKWVLMDTARRDDARQRILDGITDNPQRTVIASFNQARRYHPPRKGVISVTGKEIGKFDFSKTDKGERKAVIKQAVNAVKKLYNGFKGLVITNPDVGNDTQILLGEHGMSEWTGRAAIPEKLMAMAKLPEIISTAHAISGWVERHDKIDPETGNKKKVGHRKAKHDSYMTLQNEVNIAGKQYTVLVNLSKTDGRVYFYNLRIPALEDTRSRNSAMSTQQSQEERNVGSANENIDDSGVNVKQTAPTGTVRGKTDFYREQTIIGVFKTGDKSTLLHELGHVFLQELSEFARLEGTSQDVRDDWEKLSAWLGISDIDPAHPMDDEQKARWQNAHEKFAAHFEAYLMEGVAPTEELKSAFRRFKEWLCRIYQAVKNIRWVDTKGVYHQVEMSDEVRGFFKRLFAAQEAIEEQEIIGRIDERTEAMREAMRNAGASEETVAAIDSKAAERLERAVERITSDFMQDTTDDAKDDLDSIVNELLPGIREELREEPIYNAIETMRMIPESRMSRNSLSFYYGTKAAESVDQSILTDEGGVEPEAAAEAFGFASADEFVAALLSTPPLEEVALMEAINTAAETIGNVTESDIGELADEALFGSEDAAEDALADSVVLRDPNAIKERAAALFEDFMKHKLTHEQVDEILANNEELADAYAEAEEDMLLEGNRLNAEMDEGFWELFNNFTLEYHRIWATHGKETADAVYDALCELFPDPKERRKYIYKKKYTKSERERLFELGYDWGESVHLGYTEGEEAIYADDTESSAVRTIDDIFDKIIRLSYEAKVEKNRDTEYSKRTQKTQRANEIREEVHKLLEESGDESSPEYVLSKKLAEAEEETRRLAKEAKAANNALKKKNDPNIEKIEKLEGELAETKKEKNELDREVSKQWREAATYYEGVYKSVDKMADAAKAKLREVQGQLDALEKKSKHDEERREKVIANLREEIAAREAKLETLKAAGNEKIHEQAETIRTLRKERDSFQRKLNRQIQDAKKVDEKRAAVNKTIDDLIEMRKSVRKDVDALNKQKHLLEREVQRLQHLQDGMTNMPTEKEAAAFRKETRDKLIAEREAMKAQARELFKMKTVSEAGNVGKYTRTAEKFARKAESALRNGNLKAAAEFKRLEALNRFFAAEAASNRRILSRAKKYIGKLERQIKKDGFVTKVAPNYSDQIKAMLERFSFAQRKDFKASDVGSLRQFVEELREAGELVSIPDWVIDMGHTRRYQDLTMSEFIDVHEALRNIAYLGTISGKLLQGRSALKISEISNRLADGLRNYYKKARKSEMNPALDEQLNLFERMKDSASNFFAMLETAENICRAIDGNKEIGEAHQLIFQPVRDAVTKESMELQRIHGMMNDIIERIYGNNRASFNEYSVTLDISMREQDKDGTITINDAKKWTLTRGGLIAAVLNLGNEGNKARMMDGWHLTEAECQLFLNAISKEDMDLVQAVWDLFESELWPMAATTHTIMTGTALRQVEAVPVVTKHGTYRGGYYPIKVDMRYASISRRIKERQNMNVGMLLSEMYEYHKPETKDSHRKARAEKVAGAPPVLDIRVIDAHIGQVIHDTTMAPVVRDVHQILKAPELKQAIAETLGDNRNLALNHWLRAVALDNKNDGKYLNAVDRLMNYTRVGMIVQGLGMNIAGGILQYFGWLPLMNRIGIGRGLRGMFNSIFNRGEMIRIATERSDFMKEQMLGTDRDVRKIAEMWSVKKGGKLSAINNFVLSQYAFFQNLVNVPGWVEAYRQGLAMYQDESKAVKYADSIIRTTQSAASIADLTQLETTGTLYRMFTMFYSWFRVIHNMNLETFRRVTNEDGWGHKTAVLANHLLFVLVLPRLAEQLLRGAWKDKDPDDSWIKFLVKEGLWSIPATTAESLPFVRDIANFTSGYGTYRFTPIAAPFQSIFDLCSTYEKQFLEKDTVDYKKVLHSTLDTIGYWGHIPTRQGENIALDIYDTVMGDSEWYSALYRIVTGDRKKRAEDK